LHRKIEKGNPKKQKITGKMRKISAKRCIEKENVTGKYSKFRELSYNTM